MKTKWILTSFVVLTLTVVALSVTGCRKSEPAQTSGAKTKQYTCSMHSDVVKEAPGKCPKCGMALVEKQ